MKTPKDFTPTSPDIPAIEELTPAQATAITNDADIDRAIISVASPNPIRASDAVIEQSHIQAQSLLASTLPNIRITDCTFDRADLTGATWTDARLTRIQFNDCKLTGFDARDSDLQDLHFTNCKAPDLFMLGATLTRVRFDQCQLPNLDLTGATIKSLAIRDSGAQSLRLINTRIDHLDLRGSIIDHIALDLTNPANLRNIIITPQQAPALAIALGVQISD
tara:strand:+ start:14767 stop:15429 length:663 start_codon:yes stop_codon:yes gene_type:complete